VSDHLYLSLSDAQIPEVLAAMVDVHTRWRKAQKKQEEKSTASPRSPPRSVTENPPSLRHEAYDPPNRSIASPSMRESRYRDSPERKPRQTTVPGLTAGDLALFDANNEEGDDGIGPPELSRKTADGRDPFGRDEARTPTMRGSKMEDI